MSGLHALAHALLLAQQSSPPPVPLRDGGLCAGRIWIALEPGETVRQMRAPDATEYTIAGGGHEVRILDSFNPVSVEQLGNDVREMKGGRLYFRASGRMGPTHYSIANPETCLTPGPCSSFVWQTFIFDDRFDGSEADRKWLGRIAFGEAARAICKWKN